MLLRIQINTQLLTLFCSLNVQILRICLCYSLSKINSRMQTEFDSYVII